MNSLETEYSFLAPTWKLPTVATSSMYSRTYGSSYLPSSNGLSPDWPTWNNTTYNSRYIIPYIPSNSNRRNYPSTFTSYQSPTSRVLPQSLPSHQEGPYAAPNGDHDQLSTSYNQPAIDQRRQGYNSEDGLNLTISVHPANEYPRNLTYTERSDNTQRTNGYKTRGSTYAINEQNNYNNAQVNQRRRVQIVDNNRQTPSTTINDYAYGKNSRNSIPTPTHSQQDRTPDPTLTQSNYKSAPAAHTSGAGSVPSGPSYAHPRVEHSDDNKHGNKNNVHEYLYGLANPDPGSYVSAYKNHQRRLQDEKLGRKSVISEYKTFAQNGGFGPSFGSGDYLANIDRSNIEKKRRSYSKVVKETNQQKLDEHKRDHPTSRQNRSRPIAIPKTQRAREYAETIERPQHLRPVVRLRDPNTGNVIIRDPAYEHDPRIYS